MKHIMRSGFSHLSKFKRFSRHLFFVAAAVVMLAVPAFAVDPVPTFDLSATMTTAITKMVGDLFIMIGALLPVALSLLGISVGVSYGIKFIKGIFAKT